MQFNQNINWIAVITIAFQLIAAFGITLNPELQKDLLIGIPALAAAITMIVHTFVNHPNNVANMKASMTAAGVEPAKIARAMLPLVMVFLLVPTFLLAGCTSINGIPVPGSAAASTGTVEDQLKNLSQYTLADLDIAEADAIAHGDKISTPCYPALQRFIESIPGVTTVGGAFAAFQRGRDLRNFAAGGLPDYLQLGCGPLYAQVHGDLLLFLSQIAPVHPVILPLSPSGG